LLIAGLVWARGAQAQGQGQAQGEANAGAATAAQVVDDNSEAPEPNDAQAEAVDEAASPENAVSDAEAVANAKARVQRRSSVEHALSKARAERDNASTLAPWLLTASGIAAIAVGVGWGAGKTLNCERSCTTSFVPGWIVVGGTGLLTAGIIWLSIETHDIAELDRRRHSLEQELQYLEWNEAHRVPPTQAGFALTWRGTF
jgi:hypothetical protein